jgi:hypothetical protein
MFVSCPATVYVRRAPVVVCIILVPASIFFVLSPVFLEISTNTDTYTYISTHLYEHIHAHSTHVSTSERLS